MNVLGVTAWGREVFTRRSLAHLPGHAELAHWASQPIARLTQRRIDIVRLDRSVPKASIAWKLAIFQQSMLYRAVALAKGITESWSAGNGLSAVIVARSLIETIAAFAEIEACIRSLWLARDLVGIDEALKKATFGTRLADWLTEYPDLAATNILTSVKKLDRDIPGVSFAYDHLSERAHPNSLGHVQMFCSIDIEQGAANFSDELTTNENTFLHIAIGISLLGLFEDRLARLDRTANAMLEEIYGGNRSTCKESD